jgi:hypothetical protein
MYNYDDTVEGVEKCKVCCINGENRNAYNKIGKRLGNQDVGGG